MPEWALPCFPWGPGHSDESADVDALMPPNTSFSTDCEMVKFRVWGPSRSVGVAPVKFGDA